MSTTPMTKGVWSDFVMQIHWDHRKSTADGQGFIKAWLQTDGNGFTQILDFAANPTKGVGYDAGTRQISTGIYGPRSQPVPRILYQDSIKIGDENSSLGEMAPG